MTLKNIARGEVLSAGTFNPNVDAKNVQWYHTENVTETGVLFTLEFEVSAEASTGEEFAVQLKLSNDLAVNFSNDNFDAVNVNFTDGAVTIQANTSATRFTVEEVPTANDGKPVTSTNSGTISAITVPIRYSGTGEQVAEIAAAFYDAGGRFVGFGTESTTISNDVKAVEIPVRRYADNLKKLKVLILDTALAPLAGINSYDLP